ncbi:MAG: protein-L-isoaspartate(D-aspartate) O-methyltransferase [Chloroflexi bacterium]|nr:protein-L-isoaspartate(D-aspartate) O-methyltransferase [Chloroflexota bacterium]
MISRGSRILVMAIGATIILAVILVLVRLWRSAPPPPASSPTSQSAESAVPSVEDKTTIIARHKMVEDIKAQGLQDEAVLQAMDTVPRHNFVPPEALQDAYDDRPLPIGYGQTISSPYIVAWMTMVLHLKPGDRVLEIGTGSGYQAAILAQMGMEVYSMEIIEALANQAAARLAYMGYKNITVMQADGYYGWSAQAPYDAIIVTCAPDHIPPALVGQLTDSGRMVLPVGPPGSYQTLWLVEKRGDQVLTTNLGDVIFVPLTGQHSAG